MINRFSHRKKVGIGENWQVFYGYRLKVCDNLFLFNAETPGIKTFMGE
jgi:hypothetical protein